MNKKIRKELNKMFKEKLREELQAAADRCNADPEFWKEVYKASEEKFANMKIEFSPK